MKGRAMTLLQSATEFLDFAEPQSNCEQPILMADFQCNAVCPYCNVTQNCPKEPNHYGPHLCPTGHGF
jgi:hypothetical protein